MLNLNFESLQMERDECIACIVQKLYSSLQLFLHVLALTFHTHNLSCCACGKCLVYISEIYLLFLFTSWFFLFNCLCFNATSIQMTSTRVFQRGIPYFCAKDMLFIFLTLFTPVPQIKGGPRIGQQRGAFRSSGMSSE